MKGRPIVVGFDNDAAAPAAMRWAADQSDRTTSELVIVYVTSSVGEWELAAVQIDPDPIRRDQRLLDSEWDRAARERGTQFRTQVAVGRAATELMRIAQAEEASLIVIGMTGHGTLSELITGSTQSDLRRHAVRPVVAVPESWLAESR